MKNKILLTVAALALAFTLPIHAQTTNAPPLGTAAATSAAATTAAPLVIAPVTATVLQPCPVKLTPAQVAALVTVLAQNGITFSGGAVQNINLRLSFAKAPSAQGMVTFYPTAPTN